MTKIYSPDKYSELTHSEGFLGMLNHDKDEISEFVNERLLDLAQQNKSFDSMSDFYKDIWKRIINSDSIGSHYDNFVAKTMLGKTYSSIK